MTDSCNDLNDLKTNESELANSGLSDSWVVLSKESLEEIVKSPQMVWSYIGPVTEENKTAKLNILYQVFAYLSSMSAKAADDVATSNAKAAVEVPTTNVLDNELKDFILFPASEDNASDGEILTFHFCGTSSKESDSKKYKEYNFGNAHTNTYRAREQSTEYTDTFIVNGPGSGEEDVEGLLADYPKEKYSKEYGQLLGKGIPERITHFRNVLKIILTGCSVESLNLKEPLNEKQKALVAKLLTTREYLIKHNKKIKRINLHGWSRGAAACISLGNVFEELIAEIKQEMSENKYKSEKILLDLAVDTNDVNLKIRPFLFDPVPGFGLADKYNTKLSKLVDYCFVIYSAHERSFGFNCVIPKAHPGCIFIPIIMPGGHAHVVGNDKDHGGKTIENAKLHGVGLISQFLMQHLLLHFGTKLNPKKLTQLKLSDLPAIFAEVKQQVDNYSLAATRVPYTINQIKGQERLVIWGDENYTNHYMTVALPEKYHLYSPNDTYLNYFHKIIDMTVNQAKEMVQVFAEKFNEALTSNQVITETHIDDLLKNLFSQAKENGDAMEVSLWNRALLEAWQLEFRPHHFLNLNELKYTENETKSYIKKELKREVEHHNAMTGVSKDSITSKAIAYIDAQNNVIEKTSNLIDYHVEWLRKPIEEIEKNKSRVTDEIVHKVEFVKKVFSGVNGLLENERNLISTREQALLEIEDAEGDLGRIDSVEKLKIEAEKVEQMLEAIQKIVALMLEGQFAQRASWTVENDLKIYLRHYHNYYAFIIEEFSLLKEKLEFLQTRLDKANSNAESQETLKKNHLIELQFNDYSYLASYFNKLKANLQKHVADERNAINELELMVENKLKKSKDDCELASEFLIKCLEDKVKRAEEEKLNQAMQPQPQQEQLFPAQEDDGAGVGLELEAVNAHEVERDMDNSVDVSPEVNKFCRDIYAHSALGKQPGKRSEETALFLREQSLSNKIANSNDNSYLTGAKFGAFGGLALAGTIIAVAIVLYPVSIPLLAAVGLGALGFVITILATSLITGLIANSRSQNEAKPAYSLLQSQEENISLRRSISSPALGSNKENSPEEPVQASNPSEFLNKASSRYPQPFVGTMNNNKEILQSSQPSRHVRRKSL